MHGIEFIVVVLIAVPLTIVLLKYKAKLARKVLTEHFQEAGSGGSIEKVGMPPARLWLHSRKGDSWCLVRLADGSQKWARLGFRRRSIGGKVPVEFFE
jgi:hypothetical protein